MLESLDRAYQAGDAEAVAALVARDPKVVFFGADVAEKWVGHDAIRAGVRAEMRRGAVEIEAQPPTVHVRGDIAWFERYLVINERTQGAEVSIFTRHTGVLEKREGEWRLVQSHRSVGAPRDSGPDE